MSAKTKIWLLVGVVATLAVGVTLGILNHRDKPSQKPAAEASAPEKREIETPNSSAPAQPAALPKQNAEQPPIDNTIHDAASYLARGTIHMQTDNSLTIILESGELEFFDIRDKMMTAKRFPEGQHVVVGYEEKNGHKIAKYIKPTHGTSLASKPAERE